MFDYEDIKREVKRLLRIGEDSLYDEDILQFYKTTYWQIKSQCTSLSPMRHMELFTEPGKSLYRHDSQGRLFSSILQINTAILTFMGETGPLTQLGGDGAAVNYPLQRIQADQALIWQQTPGQPYFWDYYDSTIRLYPTPNTKYLITFVVSQAGASDSDDIQALEFSDDFLHIFRLNVYLLILQNVLKDTEQAQLVQQQVAQELQRLTVNYRNQVSTGRIVPAGLSYHTGQRRNRSWW